MGKDKGKRNDNIECGCECGAVCDCTEEDSKCGCDNNGIRITPRDRLLFAWQKSTELVRDFQAYSQEIDGDESLCVVFSKFAEDEAHHAARLLEMIHLYEK